MQTRILLASADPADLALANMLRGLGYVVDTIDSNKVLFDTFMDTAPNVILMNYKLSDTDGINAIYGLRDRKGIDHPPFILLTVPGFVPNNGRPIVEVESNGHFSVFEKPISLNKLQDEITQVLRLAKRATAA